MVATLGSSRASWPRPTRPKASSPKRDTAAGRSTQCIGRSCATSCRPRRASIRTRPCDAARLEPAGHETRRASVACVMSSSVHILIFSAVHLEHVRRGNQACAGSRGRLYACTASRPAGSGVQKRTLGPRKRSLGELTRACIDVYLYTPRESAGTQRAEMCEASSLRDLASSLGISVLTFTRVYIVYIVYMLIENKRKSSVYLAF